MARRKSGHADRSEGKRMKATLKTMPEQSELGALLRRWRDVRGKSQFDLSLDTGVSQSRSASWKADAACRTGRH